jgi:hypothetical protein
MGKYRNLELEDANEAETRLKLINEIIFSILGWTHSDVKVEERVSEDGRTTFCDYVVRTANTAFIIEAKRVGVAFTGLPNLRRIALRGAILEGEIGKAIIQARDYARKLGIPFAVITNGAEWLIFPATRVDQVKFNDSSAIVFPSLISVLEDDFSEFMGALSRESVINGSLENELLGRISNQIEQRRLNAIFTTPFSRVQRHSLFPLIEEAITIAFTEEIVQADADLLKKCYVMTPERVRFDSRIQMHIAKKDSVLAVAARRPMKDGDQSALLDLINAAAKRARPLAVLILGLVGSGKTTFLHYSRNVSGEPLFVAADSKPYPHWIYIDFRDFSANETPFGFIYDALKKYIQIEPFLSSYERCLQFAYKEEIEGLFRGPLNLLATDETERKRRISELLMADYNVTKPYVDKVLAYASRNTPIFLVVDNVDQFEVVSQQSAIFSDAMAIAHKLNLNLVLAMRDGTYVKHRSSPVFDAFDFDPIAIDPPQVDAVLS